ncbi:protein translocase subunit SecF [Orenia marismortui]|uniref:Protein-export membrane protein SecF n=1 Tax=Orenia marismortui TaxID=46469 RepID=A0A4R8GT67_9FIRM|nr:protein translocase subunit SecF [Orenia marismortui]TDX48008.1 protein translocase subunit secF [Orenia marismortui]
MDIIAKRRLWMSISGIIILVGLVSILFQGMNPGIDFSGGTIMEFTFDKNISNTQIRDILKEMNLDKKSVVQQTENNSVLIRTEKLASAKTAELENNITSKFTSAKMLRTEAVGATIGKELRTKALLALLLAALAIVAYISMRFEFRFAVAAILALLHDVLIVLGIFSLLRIEINSPFVAALLTIVGYSINDTIVIFDRIREKMKLSKKETFAELTNEAILDTLPRSINTSLTTLLPILAIIFLGGTTIQNFMIALLIGMLSGTYSSIFVASPILVEWDQRKNIKR